MCARVDPGSRAGRLNPYRRDSLRKRLAARGDACAICGRPIDYTLSWWVDPADGKRKRHPMSFEADHIVPLAQGGDNTLTNMQAVHRVCNQRAGDKLRARPRCMPVHSSELPTSRSW